MSTVFLLGERILHPTNDERKTAAEGGVNEGKPLTGISGPKEIREDL